MMKYKPVLAVKKVFLTILRLWRKWSDLGNYFSYQNSLSWKMLRYLNLFFILLLIASVAGCQISILPDFDSSVIAAIATSYIVSFLFYAETSAKDKFLSDKESLKQLKTIAYCKTVFEGMAAEIGSVPCSHKESFKSFDTKCSHTCKWKKNELCMYSTSLKFYANFLERKINSSLLVISANKPEILNPFSIVHSDIQKLKFCLENDLPVPISSFTGIKISHSTFMRDNDEGRSRNLYRDADVIEKQYKEYYAECRDEIQPDIPSHILALGTNVGVNSEKD